MDDCEKDHSVRATLRVEAPIVADGIDVRVFNSALLKKLAARAFDGGFSRFDMPALRFPSVALFVLGKDPFTPIIGADYGKFVSFEITERINSAFQLLRISSRPSFLALRSTPNSRHFSIAKS